MADDQSQRPYRASEPPVRSAAKPLGNDPLAELARLIGQTDPFAEYGREAARRTATPRPGEQADWNTPPLGSPYAPQAGGGARSQVPTQKLGGNGYFAARPAPVEQPVAAPQSYGGQNYSRQPYGGAPLSTGSEPYQAEQDAHGEQLDQADYEQDSYELDTHHRAEEDYYEDAPPSRRRLGILAIVGVFALAIVGTAGAFGYRALFGTSASHQPPPVIKADTGPSKVVPAAVGKDAQSSKLITDRVNERGESEKLVSREEQPIEKPAVATLPQAGPQSSLGSGVVASEPKKIRTIAIHPDQSVVADATPATPTNPSIPSIQSSPPATVPPRATQVPPAPATRAASPLARAAADTSTADVEQNQATAQDVHVAPPARQAAPAPSNAPLSLSPTARAAAARTASNAERAPTERAPSAERAPAAAPARTASVAPAAASSRGTGGAANFVQVSSQRSESEAQSAFRALQAKFPNQLGGRQPLVHKVELGAKGTYYRAMVGPFATANEAVELCTSLKAAGGQCLVQRN